ncbi:MAG: hypothetical protein ACRD38_00280 [Nitrososphaerales archaeon]
MKGEACKRELKRIEWKIIGRLMMVIGNEGSVKKTVVAMKSGLSYDRCVLYLQWMKTMDLIRKEIDEDGFELISLSDRGYSLYELKFKNIDTNFVSET